MEICICGTGKVEQPALAGSLVQKTTYKLINNQEVGQWGCREKCLIIQVLPAILNSHLT
jgi:hypothetical protein